jgi:hypothetical protein
VAWTLHSPELAKHESQILVYFRVFVTKKCMGIFSEAHKESIWELENVSAIIRNKEFAVKMLLLELQEDHLSTYPSLRISFRR